MTVGELYQRMTVREFLMWQIYAQKRASDWERKTQKGKKQIVEVW